LDFFSGIEPFFSLVLINLIIFGYSLPAYLTDERTKKSYERAKNLHSALRYLDEVVERVVSHGEAPTEAPSDNKTEPLPDIIPSGGGTEKPKQNTQVLTYGNFEAEKTDKSAQTSTIEVTYSMVIYYADGKVAKTVVVTIRLNIVTRRSRVRNLEETTEDVETTCNLTGENDGVGIYDCKGQTKTKGSDIEGAEINTNEPMTINGQKISMSDVAFSEAAAEIGKNLHNSTITIDTSATPYMLKKGKIEEITKTSFKVSGIIKNFKHNQGDKFNFTFHNKKDDENIEVICTVDSKDGDNVVFKCPVNKEFDAIIDQAVGTSIPGGSTVTFNFKDGEQRNVVLEGSNSGGNKAQILTYGNFEAEKTDKSATTSTIEIKYIMLIFFPEGQMPKVIEITITVYIITKRSRVRNLAETTEDVKTTCTLKDGNDGVGVYDCQGQTKTQGSDIEGAEVNTKVPMIADVKQLDIAFSEVATEIGKNLHNSTVGISSTGTPYMLKKGKIEEITKTSFKVSGTIKNFKHNQGDKFNFTFHDNNDEENIEVICTVDSKDGDNVVFKCPVNKPLNAIIDKAVGKYIGNSDDTVTFNFNDGEQGKVVMEGSGGNKAYYRKNSSGLSDGAIAGIVIASAVALIVASVVAMMFRKSKPIENVSSTNVGLNPPEHF